VPFGTDLAIYSPGRPDALQVKLQLLVRNVGNALRTEVAKGLTRQLQCHPGRSNCHFALGQGLETLRLKTKKPAER
jgi:hypothetical protein